jgi:streptomycin 6-kinase
VSLREIVLAWFEARGYRASPASPVVRPIELVLRHKDDPARAYAFVVATERVDGERVQQLTKQARGIGLVRVLIVADAGLASEAPAVKKGVRVMDRAAMNDEMKKLDVSIAAKIIAVARKRAAAAA